MPDQFNLERINQSWPLMGLLSQLGGVCVPGSFLTFQQGPAGYEVMVCLAEKVLILAAFDSYLPNCLPRRLLTVFRA